MGPLGIGGRKPPRLNPQIERESWRLLATLERLDRDTRMRIGDELLARTRKEPRNGSLLWALGRLGARRPFYGPLDRTVPPAVAERWLDMMLAWTVIVPDALGAIAQIAARVDDAALDIDEAHRAAVVELLEAANAGPDLLDAVQHARSGTRSRCGALLRGDAAGGVTVRTDETVMHNAQCTMHNAQCRMTRYRRTTLDDEMTMLGAIAPDGAPSISERAHPRRYSALNRRPTLCIVHSSLCIS